MKHSHINFLALMLFSFFLSGCAVVGAAYDVVTLPIVLVGEAAGGIADAVSDDDEDDKKDDDEKKKDDATSKEEIDERKEFEDYDKYERNNDTTHRTYNTYNYNYNQPFPAP